MNRSLFAVVLMTSFAQAQVPADKALATMKAADGLQVELFAAEPMLINPTNMDIDPLGRVWITEAVNYRTHLRKKPLNREEGDRIVILTDKDGDGKADESTVFYQGKELYGPLGICIVPFSRDAKALRSGASDAAIGYRVLISQSPDILEFWDRDGDGKADGPPTKFLSGFGGYDHDHGVHSIQVGPDGKFYFTVGDQGFKDLKSSDGKQAFTQNRTTMQAGTVWRCDPDGKNIELLAHNFRNPYEACVDSFGEIWLSDNDDDGNQQTRICYVMPGGNYGYWPRGKGESHWHEEQPGIVHKTLRTGFGSPCGITTYEGSLLPEKYRGQLIHADAGPREIRCFHKKPKGAGYELDKTLMLTSTDNWFRPSDVCVAPDGSVFVCDWYDPGVGGHGMGDTTRGRVYRITPKDNVGYRPGTIRLSDSRGLIDCFVNPCSTRQILARQPLIEWAANGYSSPLGNIRDDFATIKTPLYSARLLWCAFVGDTKLLLSTMGKGSEPGFVGILIFAHIRGLKSEPGMLDSLAQYNMNVVSFEKCREILLGIRNDNPDSIIKLFYKLAARYDGQDRTYLAALNIACGTDPARRDAILADFDKHFPEWNDKVADLVWELRPTCMMPKLDGLLKDAKLTPKQKARIVDILATSDDPNAGRTMLAILGTDAAADVKTKAMEHLIRFLPGKWSGLLKGPELKDTAMKLLKEDSTKVVGLQLMGAAGTAGQVFETDYLSDFARAGNTDAVRRAAIEALARMRSGDTVEYLAEFMNKPNDALSPAAAAALGMAITTQGSDPVSQLALKKLQEKLASTAGVPVEVLNAVLAALASNKPGTQWLLQQQEQKKLSAELAAEAGKLLRNSPFQGERNKALILFPAVAKLDLKKLPSPTELAKRRGDAKAGRAVFLASFKGDAQCMKCHTINKEGGAIGPDLSAIGKKASKENLYESILQPSKAIADQFITWKIESEDGSTATGLIVKETPTEVQLRDANGKDYTFMVKDVAKKKTTTSLMAEDVVKALTEQELVDLVEYLFSLKE